MRRVPLTACLIVAVFFLLPIHFSIALAGDAPPLVHSGMVFTYRWAAMVSAGTEHDYQENANGEIVDLKTGKSYSQSARSGTSGSGWNQTLVTCIDGDKAIYQSRGFGDTSAMGNPDPVPQPGGLGGITSASGGALGDTWVAPAMLAQLHDDPATGLAVARGPWKAGDRMVNGVRTVQISDKGCSINIYDAQSGFLEHYFTSTRGAPPQIYFKPDSGQADTHVTYGDFISVRDVPVPWKGQPVPDALREVKSLVYRGEVTFPGGMPVPPQPLSAEFRILDRGNGWITLSAPGTPLPVTAGNDQLGGTFAGPAGLEKLAKGDVLDVDPVTRMRTTVSAVAANSIVITAANRSGEISFEYDKRSGVLVAMRTYDILSKQQRVLRLQR